MQNDNNENKISLFQFTALSTVEEIRTYFQNTELNELEAVLKKYRKTKTIGVVEKDMVMAIILNGPVVRDSSEGEEYTRNYANAHPQTSIDSWETCIRNKYRSDYRELEKIKIRVKPETTLKEILQYAEESESDTFKEAIRIGLGIEGEMMETTEIGADQNGTEKSIDIKNEICSAIKNHRQVVFTGAPGTGKTWAVRKVVAELIKEDLVEGSSEDEIRETTQNDEDESGYEWIDKIINMNKKIFNPEAPSESGLGLSESYHIGPAYFKDLAKENDDFETENATNREFSKEIEERVKFVQFHSSYDYTDFVEGLRPVPGNGGNVFVRMDGVFKEFCRRIVEANLDRIRDTEDAGIRGLNINLVEGDYEKSAENYYKFMKNASNKDRKTVMKFLDKKVYYFIIDEINRADLSKVFGELMFGLEESYREVDNRFATQYMNLHTYSMESTGDCFRGGFFVPHNLKIIGTMNDIDRSVETFDFALRRRFVWIDIKANEVMKKSLISMGAENDNEKLEKIFEHRIEPILREYTRGRRSDNGLIKNCREALLGSE